MFTKGMFTSAQFAYLRFLSGLAESKLTHLVEDLSPNIEFSDEGGVALTCLATPRRTERSVQATFNSNHSHAFFEESTSESKVTNEEYDRLHHVNVIPPFLVIQPEHHALLLLLLSSTIQYFAIAIKAFVHELRDRLSSQT